MADKKLDEEEKEDDDKGSLDFMLEEEVLIRTIDAKMKSGSLTEEQADTEIKDDYRDKEQEKYGDKEQDKYGDKDQDKYKDKDQVKYGDEGQEKYGDEGQDKYEEEYDEEEAEEFIQPVEKEILVKSVKSLRSIHSIKHISSQRGKGGSAMKSVFSFKISKRRLNDDRSESHVEVEIIPKSDGKIEEEVKAEEKEERD